MQVETNGNPVNENFRRFRYDLGVTVREVYDDNINISSINRISDPTVIEPESISALATVPEGSTI